MNKLREIKTFSDFLDDVAKAQFGINFSELNNRPAITCATIKGIMSEAAELYCAYRIEQAIADYEKSKWKTGFPDLIEGKHYSKNVLAEVEGYTDLQVMCLCWIASENDGESGYVWANCYGKIDGECEFDDNHNVIRWTEIPTTPKP